MARFAWFSLFLLSAVMVSPSHAKDMGSLISPGDLSSYHGEADGLTNCTKCHVIGSGITNAACENCHKDVAAAIASQKGYHSSVSSQKCIECHSDHKGRDFKLVEWDKKKFDHSKAGYDLVGRHKGVDCQKCHKTKTKAGVDGYLGALETCKSCHDDVHKGEFKEPCETCHNVEGWKGKNVRFDHNKPYALDGKHANVQCEKCHPVKGEFRVAEKEKCVTCHQKADKHKGQLGSSCEKCHKTASWKEILFDHFKTKYALQGKHKDASCDKCHPAAKKTGVFKVARYDACDAPGCHDAGKFGNVHGTQFAGQRCEKCHSTSGFKPSSYAHEGEGYAGFVLKGRHAQTKCQKCHVADPVTKAVLYKPIQTASCDGAHCHDVRERGNVHGPQFKGQKCDACHNEQGWKPTLFRHDSAVYAGYKLEGRHAQTPCDKCHRPDSLTKAVSYKPIGTASCDAAGCHDVRGRGNVHGAQFKGRRCQTCHNEQGWKPTLFKHDSAGYAGYKLEGRHAQTPCGKCHPSAADQTVFYKPIRYDSCSSAACHKNPHAEQFKGQKCETCHNEQGWKPTLFKHESAGYAGYKLEGRHAQTPCGKCHPSVAERAVLYKPIRYDSCASAACHKNPHAEQFEGKRCEQCHVVKEWKELSFSHRTQARFPLEGKHAAARCDKCHLNKAWRPLAMNCLDCHRRDDEKAHKGKMGVKCDQCHTAQNWAPNNFFHEVTGFTLDGTHSQAACGQCHNTKGVYSGLGPQCSKCHTDPHLNQFGPAACGDCHTAKNWFPEKFNHSLTGFRLEGGHRAAACQQCHRNRTYRNTPYACIACHQADFTSPAAAPFHVGVSTDCTLCHKVYGWQGAKFAHKTMTFTGYHSVIASSCTSCHAVGANFSLKWPGVTNETQCGICHATQAHGTCPTNCSLCHNTTTFAGAQSIVPCKPSQRKHGR